MVELQREESGKAPLEYDIQICCKIVSFIIDSEFNLIGEGICMRLEEDLL